MALDRTKRLFSGDPDTSDPLALLEDVLAASIELVSLEDNDFSWSSWGDAAAAIRELNQHIAALRLPNRPDIEGMSVIFAPTGPMQELSLSSGWSEPFVKLASYFDAAAEGVVR